jgi:hypothetical protein
MADVALVFLVLVLGDFEDVEVTGFLIRPDLIIINKRN